jgi:hypothetical protein
MNSLHTLPHISTASSCEQVYPSLWVLLNEIPQVFLMSRMRTLQVVSVIFLHLLMLCQVNGSNHGARNMRLTGLSSALRASSPDTSVDSRQ